METDNKGDNWDMPKRPAPTSELAREHQAIEDALWEIEHYAQEQGVSQFKGFMERKRFIRKYALRLHKRLIARRNKGWKQSRLDDYAMRWDAENGKANIRQFVAAKKAA